MVVLRRQQPVDPSDARVAYAIKQGLDVLVDGTFDFSGQLVPRNLHPLLREVPKPKDAITLRGHGHRKWRIAYFTQSYDPIEARGPVHPHALGKVGSYLNKDPKATSIRKKNEDNSFLMRLVETGMSAPTGSKGGALAKSLAGKKGNWAKAGRQINA